MNTATCLPLQQHPNFATALRHTGCDVRELNLPGAAPVQTISRFGLTFASRGPIWRDPRDPSCRDALRRSRLHMINSEGDDLDVLPSAGYRQVHTAGYVAELSLAGMPDDRLRRMKPKWRNTLRRALKTPRPLETQRFCAQRHSWLLAEDLRQQRSKGFRSLPHTILLAYADANPREVVVLVASGANGPMAAMLYLIHGHVATYHLGWSNDDGRRNAAHHALLLQACDRFSARGVKRIDLGAVDTVNAPGLARFKIGSGAVIRPLGGTWLRVPWL